MYLSGYRYMWVLAMFDLPVVTPEEKKRYARFRKVLLRAGFRQLQFSVYARDCPSRENARVHVSRVEQAVPEAGEVRILLVTDKQYERMEVFWGKAHRPAEKPAPQLALF